MDILIKGDKVTIECKIDELIELIEDKENFKEKLLNSLPQPSRYGEAEYYINLNQAFTAVDIFGVSATKKSRENFLEWLKTQPVVTVTFDNPIMSVLIIPYKIIKGRKVYSKELSPKTQMRHSYKKYSKVKVVKGEVILF
jgi:hypothetical protein